MLLIIEIALGVVLGAFLLWVINAIARYRSPMPGPNQEPTVWVISIGDLAECIFDKEKGKGYCCRDKVFDPAFANTVHQFETFEEARDWAKELVNVRLRERWESPDTKYWHGNFELMEVTPSVAARWMEHRIPGGKVDPNYLAECAARLKVADERRAAEEAAHLVRMEERKARRGNPSD